MFHRVSARTETPWGRVPSHVNPLAELAVRSLAAAPLHDFCHRSRTSPVAQPVRSGNRLNEFIIEKIKAPLPEALFSRGSNQILNHFSAHFPRKNVTGVEAKSASSGRPGQQPDATLSQGESSGGGTLVLPRVPSAASGGEFRRRNSVYYRSSVRPPRQDLRVSIQAQERLNGMDQILNNKSGFKNI